MQKKNVFLVILFFVVVAISVFLIKSNIDLKEENQRLNSIIKIKTEEYNTLEIKHDELNTTYLNLVSEYNQNITKYNQLMEEDAYLKNKYENLEITHEELQEQYVSDWNYFKSEVQDYIEIVQTAMQWYNYNSTIDNLKEATRIKSLLKNNCLDCKDNVCNIKTACIFVINKEELNLEYEIDQLTSGKADQLQDIQTFLDHEKGDCEDFSLLFTAQLRYLIDYVKSTDRIPVVEAIIKSDTKKDYFITNKWYYPEGIEKKEIDSEFIYPYVVCGQVFDPQADEHRGHCVIALSNKEIQSVDNIDYLSNSYLIEPQNGLFVDNLEKDIIFIGKGNKETRINTLIIKDDIYLHDSIVTNKENKWHNYMQFLYKLEITKEH